MANRIRVALVDDHFAVREGLQALLADEPGIDVVAVAASAAEAYDKIELEQPDLVILDYNLPGEDGLSLCFRLKSLPSPPRVLILSAFADDTLSVLAALAGADGVVSKGAAIDMYETAAALVAGEKLVTQISPQVLTAAGSKLDPDDLPVLGMLVHGVPADEIAETLGIDAVSLAARRRDILRRLRAREAGQSSALLLR